MKKWIMMLGSLAAVYGLHAQNFPDKNYPLYDQGDLGCRYTPGETVFRLWAPTALQARVHLYKDDLGGVSDAPVSMKKGEKGTWVASVKSDIQGRYYAFSVLLPGPRGAAPRWTQEVSDPWARAVGRNGKRSQVIDPARAYPENWEQDRSPALAQKNDAILYELHVRDASIHLSSGISAKGKYLGLTETGTRNKAGQSTGLDHIRELGVTHVHLLPVYDFNSVDETRPDSVQYNWGYDPVHYNTTEGSYSTNAADGATRIREFRQLIQAFHRQGLRVVMDVVYNHTALSANSAFNQLVPGYFYRQKKDGSFSNATACGNETASERPMFRQFMLESLRYWVQEFHVDGFRFDLMGVHDIETMNLISRELHQLRPDILLYGEGWTAGASPLPDSLRALKANAAKLDRVAVFCDDIRDGIKGSVFEHRDRGFASGKPGMEESVKFGIVAATRHPQVEYGKVNYSKAPFADDPAKTIVYVDCHDNHTLWDKLQLSASASEGTDAPPGSVEPMQRLALSIVLTSQGIPFLHAGSEFLRTKQGVENSYKSPDDINAIDWTLKSANRDVYEYVKALVALRKAHPAFRLTTAEQIRQQLRFIDGLPEGLIAYELNGKAAGDSWSRIRVYFNGSAESRTLDMKGPSWTAAVRDNRFVTGETVKEKLELKPHSCSILYLQE